MAIKSIGYQGSITTDDEWGRVSTYGSRYGVELQGDFAVTTVPNGERAVRVAPGTAWGKGILDVSDAQVQVPVDPATAPSRWDTVVLRRNRDTKTTSVVVVKGSEYEQIAPSRLYFSPTSRIDDQPLAMINVTQVAGTQGRVGTVYDVRCWAANSGLVIKSFYAMEYLGVPGARVTLSGEVFGGRAMPLREFVFAEDSSGTWQWMRPAPVRIEVDGASGEAQRNSFIKATTVTLVTNSNGDASHVFNEPFPNALLTAVITDATSTTNLGAVTVKYMEAFSDRTKVSVRPYGASGALRSTPIRITFIAIGY